MGVMQRLLLFSQVDSSKVAVNSRYLCRVVQLFLRFKAHFDVFIFYFALFKRVWLLY